MYLLKNPVYDWGDQSNYSLTFESSRWHKSRQDMACSHSIPTYILPIRVGSAMARAVIPGSDVLRSVAEYCSIWHSYALCHSCLVGLLHFSLGFCTIFKLSPNQEIFDELQPIFLGPHIFPSSPNFTPWRAVDIFFTFFHLFTGALFSMSHYSEISLFFTTCSHSLGFRCSCHLLPWCNAQSPVLNFPSLWHGMPPATIFMYRWFKGGLSCHLFVCDISSY